jgi:menaquinone-dependent protoporphyrinogen oxidase
MLSKAKGSTSSWRLRGEVDDLSRFNAVIVGGALYANRWHRAARKFVKRHEDELRAMPVWFFSSGPLDDSAESRDIPPTKQVSMLMERAGARGHVTFGGRLSRDPRGFVASKMARKHAGDWRSRDHVWAWATEMSASLRAAPQAQPRALPSRRERSRVWLAVLCLLAGLTRHARWLAFSFTRSSVGRCAAQRWRRSSSRHRSERRSSITRSRPQSSSLAWQQAIFHGQHAWVPLRAAILFAVLVGMFDLVIVASFIQHSLAMFQSFVGSWLPLLLIFVATWMTGILRIHAHTRHEVHAQG